MSKMWIFIWIGCVALLTQNFNAHAEDATAEVITSLNQVDTGTQCSGGGCYAYTRRLDGTYEIVQLSCVTSGGRRCPEGTQCQCTCVSTNRGDSRFVARFRCVEPANP